MCSEESVCKSRKGTGRTENVKDTSAICPSCNLYINLHTRPLQRRTDGGLGLPCLLSKGYPHPTFTHEPCRKNAFPHSAQCRAPGLPQSNMCLDKTPLLACDDILCTCRGLISAAAQRVRTVYLLRRYLTHRLGPGCVHLYMCVIKIAPSHTPCSHLQVR